MKLGTQSHTSIVAALRGALARYTSKNKLGVVTDIFLQANPFSGELVIFNDDDEVLSSLTVPEWIEAMPENFYEDAEVALTKVLNQLREEGLMDSVKLMRPYSFVLVDDEKETLSELMLIDDEDTMLISGGLLQGLDEELNAFLKDLLEI